MSLKLLLPTSLLSRDKGTRVKVGDLLQFSEDSFLPGVPHLCGRLGDAVRKMPRIAA